MTERTKAWLGTVAFLFAAPGVVAGLMPWVINGWRRLDEGANGSAAVAIGAAAILLGVGFLLHAFARFAQQGVGTPAPIAPTAHLVVTGVYRHVRNPMYLAVLAIIFGQALAFADARLALYGVVVFAACAAFVRGYEEPTLRDRFGDEYERYRAAVPGWIPRWRSYDG